MTTTTSSNQVICGDSAQVLKTLPDELVDLTVTSPPYDNVREYNGFSFDFEIISRELFRVMKNGSILVWIVADGIKDNSETGTSFKQALRFKEIGFNLHDTMIYMRNNGLRTGSNLVYLQRFDYMFIFSKGKPKTVNLLKDKARKYRSSSTVSSTVREKSGEMKSIKHTIPPFGIRSNVWDYNSGYMHNSSDIISYDHPASFPEKLAKDHILSWSNEGDLVLDPFAGSGTTLKMARLLNRNYIGIEISSDCCKIIEKRLAKHDNQKLEVFSQ